MSFNNGCIIEVNSGGSDSANAGGFDPGATFATDLAATSATGSSPVVTSASYNFVAGDVNKYLFVKSGTNWTPGWYKIVSVASNAATLDAAVGHVVLWNGITPLNTVAGCATTASPTAGAWGVDYSRGTSPLYSYTDMVIDATTNTKFTSAAHPVGPNIVGNFIAVTSGTGFTVQRVEVLSVSGTVATCDKSLGTLSSTGGNGGLGGALASPGMAWSLVPQAGTIFVVGGSTFDFSSSANVSGGRCSTTGVNQSVVGYTTNRHHFNQDASRPIFQSNANSISLITVNNGHCSCENIDFENGHANTTITGWDDGNGWGTDCVFNCKFNGLSVGAKVADNSITEFCWFNACTAGGGPLTIGSANWSVVRDCVFTNNTAIGLGPTLLERCVIYNSSTVSQATSAKYISDCLFHTLSSSSMVVVGTTSQSTVNCIFVNCTGSGSQVFDWSTVNNNVQALNCAFFGNTLDAVLPTTAQIYCPTTAKIVLTSDPITNPSGGDFSLNNTAGAGALLRGAAFPATFANGLTANNLDVGPAQHAASGGGGYTPHPRPVGF